MWECQNVNNYFGPLKGKMKVKSRCNLLPNRQRQSGLRAYKVLAWKYGVSSPTNNWSISSDLWGRAGPLRLIWLTETLPTLHQPKALPMSLHTLLVGQLPWKRWRTLTCIVQWLALPHPCTVVAWRQLLQVCHPPAGLMVHPWHHPSPTNTRETS